MSHKNIRVLFVLKILYKITKEKKISILNLIITAYKAYLVNTKLFYNY